MRKLHNDLFQTQEIVVTDKTQPKLYIGKRPEKPVAKVEEPKAPVYDESAIANVVRSYLKWSP